MPGSAHAPRQSAASRERGFALLVLSLVVAVAMAVLAVFAWTRPAEVASSHQYQQTGRLSYGAPTSAASAYGPAGLVTGQPIYTHVVTTVQMSYQYRLSTSGPTQLSGTEQLTATISNGQGISRTVPLQPRTAFRDSHFTATGALQVAALEAIASTFNDAAGEGSTLSYSVVISPQVELQGHVGSLPLKTAFDPPATFSLTSTALAPVSTSSSSGTTSPAPSTSGSGSAISLRQFASASTGSIVVPGGRSNTLLGLPILGVRFGSLVLFAAAAAALALLVRPILGDATSSDERVRIATRHGSSLIQVRALPASATLVAVELSSFTGLSEVARRLECPVLHLHGEATDTYGVIDNGTLYRYSIATSLPSRRSRLVPRGTDTAQHTTTDRDTTASSIRIS